MGTKAGASRSQAAAGLALGGLAALLAAPLALTPLRERLAPRELPGAQQFVRVAGYDLHYSDDGPPAGEPVLLIHGFASWAFVWRGLRAALAGAGYRAIAVDQLGYGASPRPEAPVYSTRDQADLLLGALDALGIARCHLVGHSFGGRVALQVALLAPERVRSVAAICPEAFTVARPPIAAVAALPLVGPALAFYTLAPPLVGLGLRSFTVEGGWLTPEVAAGYAAPLHVRGSVAAQVWQARSPKDGALPVPANLAAVAAPTLLIWGADDRIFPLEEGRRLARTLPRAQLQVFERTGHLPHEERPAETAAAVVGWLGAHGG